MAALSEQNDTDAIISKLVETVKTLEERLAELNKENASSAQAFFAQKIKLDAANERLAASEERIAASDARLAALEATNVAIMGRLSNAGAAEDDSRFAGAAEDDSRFAGAAEKQEQDEYLRKIIREILAELGEGKGNITELGKLFRQRNSANVALKDIATKERGYPAKNTPSNKEGITPVMRLLKDLFPNATFDVFSKDLGNGKYHSETFINGNLY